MVKQKLFPYTLKARIIILVGSIIAILMIGISFSVSFQWRNLIVNHQLKSTQELTRTIAVPILDAMIFWGNDKDEYEPYLRNQIEDFTKKISGIHYIMVMDLDDKVIAHSDITKYNAKIQDEIKKLQKTNHEMISMIHDHPEFGWIIEVEQPLKIAGKKWGNIRLGINAEPIRSEIAVLFIKLHSFILILLIITLFVIYFLVSRMTNSLHTLVENIDKVQLDSDKFQNMAIKNDEIGQLVHHFKTMEMRLSQSHTKLLAAQSQVFRAEKLASIGRLAAGVAHEINNPLNGIRNCLYSIQQEPDNEELHREYMNLIGEGIGHIESVVKKLLGFSRHSKPNIDALDLNFIIKNVLHLLAYQLDKKRIQIVENYDLNIPAIEADKSLLQEIVMNLLLNSFDAVEDNGKIVLSTGRSDSENIYFSVEDNGTGIPQELQSDIFDPFYTTKDPGEGTGLGLSVSLGIVEAHGGKINIYSIPGEKTIFTVILPQKNKI